MHGNSFTRAIWISPAFRSGLAMYAARLADTLRTGLGGLGPVLPVFWYIGRPVRLDTLPAVFQIIGIG